jgi:hypothetical protein
MNPDEVAVCAFPERPKKHDFAESGPWELTFRRSFLPLVRLVPWTAGVRLRVGEDTRVIALHRSDFRLLSGKIAAQRREMARRTMKRGITEAFRSGKMLNSP